MKTEAYKLAEHLYATFWKRQEVEAPPFQEQALAIVRMWTNIAQSAIDYKD